MIGTPPDPTPMTTGAITNKPEGIPILRLYQVWHLERANCAVLVLPAGKSGHLELGWVLGSGKPGYIVLDPAGTDANFRYDIMYRFATKVFADVASCVAYLKTEQR